MNESLTGRKRLLTPARSFYLRRLALLVLLEQQKHSVVLQIEFLPSKIIFDRVQTAACRQHTNLQPSFGLSINGNQRQLIRPAACNVCHFHWQKLQSVPAKYVKLLSECFEHWTLVIRKRQEGQNI